MFGVAGALIHRDDGIRAATRSLNVRYDHLPSVLLLLEVVGVCIHFDLGVSDWPLFCAGMRYNSLVEANFPSFGQL
jgi:hypothetical protein